MGNFWTAKRSQTGFRRTSRSSDRSRDTQGKKREHEVEGSGESSDPSGRSQKKKLKLTVGQEAGKKAGQTKMEDYYRPI
jgi:hypothetical protein